MSTLTARLNASKIEKTSEVMYSVDGAKFQEWAINRIDAKGSAAHLSIGKLVTMINNNVITVAEAESKFTALLVK